MIRTIVVDDEPLAIDLIRDHINKHKSLEFVESFSNPIEALSFLDAKPVDLILLDIQMPELNGVQFMKISHQKYNIIVTTAYEKYAVDGFENDVIDYLVKPISFERFSKAINKLIKKAEDKRIHTSENTNKVDAVFVKVEYKTVKIYYNDIYYVEALGDYISIQEKSKSTLTLERMKKFQTLLPQDRFVRIHKSYIISIDKIDFIERNEVHINGKILNIGETYKKAFWAKINS